ncbi:ribonuclease P protein component [Caldisalinibacter kiritimatiensis]|uniref:Ribonuclease P protein component n=1 Tax=Caldisalinibacter kiritimatiensis TaxID=1304284 RepID=R1AS06_9FIRM|nr:ribonuclease P protein component [Caldisalinibacter kiritimatiensis]EOC99431.1 Ribonuclease P protein component [Caldisalinibacter kiritimatiensis]
MNKKYRLRSNKEFKRVYKKGKSLANRYLVMFYIKNPYNYNRVGFTVTKKLGKAVVRNKVRRRIKEGYRLNADKVKQGYDIIFLSRVNAKNAEYKDLERAILHLIRKSGLLKKGE